MWHKTHGKALKISVSIIAVLVLGFFMIREMRAEEEFDKGAAISKQQDAEYMEKNKPLFDCLLSADAMIKKGSSDDERRVAVEAADECYELYRQL